MNIIDKILGVQYMNLFIPFLIYCIIPKKPTE
jgi:hypothetical protein